MMKLMVSIFGILPSLTFFIWFERNLALPGISLPVMELSLQPWSRVAFDAALYAAFACGHTFLARERLKERVSRGSYVIVTGLSLTALMAFWQRLGGVVWVVPGLSWVILNLVSFGIWLFFMTCLFRVLWQHDFLAFFGFREPARGHRPLETAGIYAVVRHPIYFFTLMAMLVTPFMSVDRIVLVLFTVVYLLVGVPIEERKLLRTYGNEFERYRARVPAWFPGLAGSGKRPILPSGEADPKKNPENTREYLRIFFRGQRSIRAKVAFFRSLLARLAEVGRASTAGPNAPSGASARDATSTLDTAREARRRLLEAAPDVGAAEIRMFLFGSERQGSRHLAVVFRMLPGSVFHGEALVEWMQKTVGVDLARGFLFYPFTDLEFDRGRVGGSYLLREVHASGTEIVD